jgi:hypothetical protein
MFMIKPDPVILSAANKPGPVILSAAKNLTLQAEILRCAQNDRQLPTWIRNVQQVSSLALLKALQIALLKVIVRDEGGFCQGLLYLPLFFTQNMLQYA